MLGGSNGLWITAYTLTSVIGAQNIGEMLLVTGDLPLDFNMGMAGTSRP